MCSAEGGKLETRSGGPRHESCLTVCRARAGVSNGHAFRPFDTPALVWLAPTRLATGTIGPENLRNSKPPNATSVPSTRVGRWTPRSDWRGFGGRAPKGKHARRHEHATGERYGPHATGERYEHATGKRDETRPAPTPQQYAATEPKDQTEKYSPTSASSEPCGAQQSWRR